MNFSDKRLKQISAAASWCPSSAPIHTSADSTCEPLEGLQHRHPAGKCWQKVWEMWLLPLSYPADQGTAVAGGNVKPSITTTVKAHLSKSSLTCRLASELKISSNFSSCASGYNEKYSLCLRPFDLAVSWDIAAAAKYARDLSVWFCSKVRRTFHLRGLRNVTSHLIYWGILFRGASMWWEILFWPKCCGGHRESFFLAQWLLTSVIPITTFPLLHTPPARAGSKKPQKMKSQGLWVWVFPSFMLSCSKTCRENCVRLFCLILITFLVGCCFSFGVFFFFEVGWNF